MKAHKESSNLANAALIDIIGRGQLLQAAVLRDAPGEEIETIRSEIHSVLDAFLDHTQAAAVHVRAYREG